MESLDRRLLLSGVSQTITTLFNTGVATNNPDGTPATLEASANPDPHYTVNGGQSFVTISDGFPVGSPWLANSSTSQWISPRADEVSNSDASGPYAYVTTFTLPVTGSLNPEITGNIAADNSISNILLNGQPTGFSGAGYSGFTPFTISSGFVNGINTLEFDVFNDAGATGFRVEMAGQLFGSVPTSLAFASQPVNTYVGALMSPAIVVDVYDQFGSLLSNGNPNIGLSILSGPAGAVLGGTTTVASQNGVATFSNLSVNMAGTYAFEATLGSLPPLVSKSFDVTTVPSTLVFAQPPTNVTAGSAMTPPISVDVEDQSGNILTDNDSMVTLSISSGPTGGVIGGTATVAAVDGVATFSNLILDKAGNYALVATDGGLSTQPSASIAVAPGPAAGLTFATQPFNTLANATINPAIAVDVVDAFNNLVSNDNPDITVSIASGPAGAVLSGTTTVASQNGAASFDDLSINTPGQYTLMVSGGSLSAVSSQFVVGPFLAFGQQPSGTLATTAIAPPITVDVVDQNSQPIAGNNSDVTLSIAGGPSGGVLGGALTVAAVNGVATFSDLSLNASGTYTLQASDGDFAAATSEPFIIAPLVPTSLAFSQLPARFTAGAPKARAIVVDVEDQLDNLNASFNRKVTLSIASSPSGAPMGSALVVKAHDGVVQFNNLLFETAGTYTLNVAASGLIGVTSESITVLPAAAAKLVFGPRAITAASGTAINPPIVVRVEDSFGNIVPDSSVVISLSVKRGQAPAAQSVLVADAVNGVAKFRSVTLDSAGTYKLQAASTGLESALSAKFVVANPPLFTLPTGSNSGLGGIILSGLVSTVDPSAMLDSTTGILPDSGQAAADGTLTLI